MIHSCPSSLNCLARRWSKVANPPRSGYAGPMITILLKTDFLFYQVKIPARCIPGDEFCNKSGKKQLGTDDHRQNGEKEQRALGHPRNIKKKFRDSQVNKYEKAKQETERSPCSKEMHGSFPKFAYEHNRCEVEKAIYETFEPEF